MWLLTLLQLGIGICVVWVILDILYRDVWKMDQKPNTDTIYTGVFEQGGPKEEIKFKSYEEILREREVQNENVDG